MVLLDWSSHLASFRCAPILLPLKRMIAALAAAGRQGVQSSFRALFQLAVLSFQCLGRSPMVLLNVGIVGELHS